MSSTEGYPHLHHVDLQRAHPVKDLCPLIQRLVELLLPEYVEAYICLVEDEDQATLLQRILGKLSLGKEETEAIQEGKDGAGLVYEFEGGRWSLDDGEWRMSMLKQECY